MKLISGLSFVLCASFVLGIASPARAAGITWTGVECGIGGTLSGPIPEQAGSACSMAGGDFLTMTGSGATGTNGSGLSELDFDGIGVPTGVTGDPVTLATGWNFAVNDNGATATSGTYTLTFTLGGSSEQETGDLSFTDGTATVSGTDSIDASFFNAGFIDLKVDVNMSDADLLTLTANSVYISGDSEAPTSGTPEPASLALLGSGMGALLIVRRRKTIQGKN